MRSMKNGKSLHLMVYRALIVVKFFLAFTVSHMSSVYQSSCFGNECSERRDVGHHEQDNDLRQNERCNGLCALPELDMSYVAADEQAHAHGRSRIADDCIHAHYQAELHCINAELSRNRRKDRREKDYRGAALHEHTHEQQEDIHENKESELGAEVVCDKLSYAALHAEVGKNTAYYHGGAHDEKDARGGLYRFEQHARDFFENTVVRYGRADNERIQRGNSAGLSWSENAGKNTAKDDYRHAKWEYRVKNNFHCLALAYFLRPAGKSRFLPIRTTTSISARPMSIPGTKPPRNIAPIDVPTVEP